MIGSQVQEVRRGREFQSHSEKTARYLNPDDLSGHSFSDCCLTGFSAPRRRFFFNFSLKELIDDKIGKFTSQMGNMQTSEGAK